VSRLWVAEKRRRRRQDRSHRRTGDSRPQRAPRPVRRRTRNASRRASTTSKTTSASTPAGEGSSAAANCFRLTTHTSPPASCWRRSICTTGYATPPTATGVPPRAARRRRRRRPTRDQGGSRLPPRGARDGGGRAVDEYRTDLLAFLDELAGVDTVGAVGERNRVRLRRRRRSTRRIDPLGRSSNAFAIGQNASKRSRVTSPPMPMPSSTPRNSLGEYVRTGDKTALNRARDRLSDTSDTETNHH